MLQPVTDLDRYVATRTSWHTLAERVLAPARHAVTGRIGLRPSPGGVTTPPFGEGPDGPRTIAIVGGDLVVARGEQVDRQPITTLAAAAALAGVEPGAETGAETGVYTPTTPADPRAVLAVDAGAAAALAEWFAFGQRVLEQWSAARAAATPSEIQLWPEHFDLATDLGPDDHRANYGASPGDGGHQLPYLYVGPWNPDDDPFWNAGAYARLGYEDLTGRPDPESLALEFFAAGFTAASRPGNS